MIRPCVIFLAVVWPATAVALSLQLPGQATQTADRSEIRGDVVFPVAPWSDGRVATVTAKGRIERRAWQLASAALTTLQIIEPLRKQLIDDGYRIAFECADIQCGGFDFRFELDLIGEPAMHVDLGDYRYLVASRETDAGTDYASLVVSRSASAGFVQLTRVSPEAAAAPLTVAPPDPPDVQPDAALSLEDRLRANARVVLDDLYFGSGSARLGDEEFQSLTELADFLLANPDEKVALVGHTDAVGPLSSNIALSRQRARATRDRLVSAYGVPAAQLEADGVGYLLPLAPNDTVEGRAANRRVEAVLISIE